MFYFPTWTVSERWAHGDIVSARWAEFFERFWTVSEGRSQTEGQAQRERWTHGERYVNSMWTQDERFIRSAPEVIVNITINYMYVLLSA